jgi:large subunit ribosomal protein L19
MGVIQDIEKEQLKKEVSKFKVGDTVKVFSKIIEGGKERLQGFEGIVIKRQGGSNREMFTVRRIVQGIGVERSFPLHSPKVEKVSVVRGGKVKRAKLYYLRDRVGSQATRVDEEKNA